MQEDPLQNVLDWINAFRTERGYKPVRRLYKGKPRTPEYCPISRTISAGTDKFCTAGAFTLRFGIDTFLPLPPEIMDFITAFDEGQYPDLVLKR